MRRLAVTAALAAAVSLGAAAPASADPIGCTEQAGENFQNGPGTSPVVTIDGIDVTIHGSNASYFVRATGGVALQFAECVV